MSKSLLLKGFEVELFTGLPTGKHVGVSVAVTRDLPDFATEPDQRNLEYITDPESDYSFLGEALLLPRRKLRKWLASRQLTLLPGSTLSLGDSGVFERSDQFNPYHDLIEKNYGTRVVTASIHINLGLEDLQMLFAALRLVRCEAALFLALSASSPFLDGRLTGAHSQRWLQFPLTPAKVPIFLSHAHYVQWIEEQLANGSMRNERHLWTSVRPNGPRRPYDLNRIELRICDLITNPSILLAVTALLELRVLSLLKNPSELDPLKASELDANELAALSDANDVNAAKMSLDASLHHWKDGSQVTCRNWIEELLDLVTPMAMELEISEHLRPLRFVLDRGNQAMQWLHSYETGTTMEDLLKESIIQMQNEEFSINNSEEIFG